jgi:hypothetical protein
LTQACKDKHHRAFDQHFKVELYLHRVDDDLDLTTLGQHDDGEEDSEGSNPTDDEA